MTFTSLSKTNSNERRLISKFDCLKDSKDKNLNYWVPSSYIYDAVQSVLSKYLNNQELEKLKQKVSECLLS